MTPVDFGVQEGDGSLEALEQNKNGHFLSQDTSSVLNGLSVVQLFFAMGLALIYCLLSFSPCLCMCVWCMRLYVCLFECERLCLLVCAHTCVVLRLNWESSSVTSYLFMKTWLFSRSQSSLVQPVYLVSLLGEGRVPYLLLSKCWNYRQVFMLIRGLHGCYGADVWSQSSALT